VQLQKVCLERESNKLKRDDTMLLLFSSTPFPSKFKKLKNLSSLVFYFSLITDDFIAYNHNDQVSSS
jgi:hypothetical protein